MDGRATRPFFDLAVKGPTTVFVKPGKHHISFHRGPLSAAMAVNTLAGRRYEIKPVPKGFGLNFRVEDASTSGALTLSESVQSIRSDDIAKAGDMHRSQVFEDPGLTPLLVAGEQLGTLQTIECNSLKTFGLSTNAADKPELRQEAVRVNIAYCTEGALAPKSVGETASRTRGILHNVESPVLDTALRVETSLLAQDITLLEFAVPWVGPTTQDRPDQHRVRLVTTSVAYGAAKGSLVVQLYLASETTLPRDPEQDTALMAKIRHVLLNPRRFTTNVLCHAYSALETRP